jgi:hypothetical protein
MMNEYLPLIMAATVVTVLSVGITLLTGKSVHKKEKKQRDFDFTSTQTKTKQPSAGMVARARRTLGS